MGATLTYVRSRYLKQSECLVILRNQSRRSCAGQTIGRILKEDYWTAATFIVLTSPRCYHLDNSALDYVLLINVVEWKLSKRSLPKADSLSIKPLLAQMYFETTPEKWTHSQ